MDSRLIQRGPASVEELMQDQRSIMKGLEKGLDVLVVLNRHGGLRVAEVARDLELPRTTALRILKTLAANGFIDRSEIDRRYRPTIKVRTLADGYDEDAWIAEIARPAVQALTREVGWPAHLATPFGTSMIWRVNTDHETPLTLVRLGIGIQTTILGSASGRIFLAYCTEQEQSTIVEILCHSEQEQRHILCPEALDELLTTIRSEGCALTRRASEYTLGVPILLEGRYIASLAVRVFTRAMDARELVTRYHGVLTKVAADISTTMADLSHGERRPLSGRS